MTENNSQELDNIREHEQLIALCKENYELRLKITHDKQRKITHDKQRKIMKKKIYEEKFKNLQILVNDASIRLNEGSELIRKLQKHLKICQEKLSDKTKALLAKDDTLHQYESHITHLNDIIRQLMDEKKQLIDEHTAQHLQFSLNLNDNQKIDVAIQTSPTLSVQRRCVRFNLDKENCPIDSKYFQPIISTNK